MGDPTESSRMLEVLKSLYMTGFSAPCRKASPLAAPIAIFNLVPHGNDIEIPAIHSIEVEKKVSTEPGWNLEQVGHATVPKNHSDFTWESQVSVSACVKSLLLNK